MPFSLNKRFTILARDKFTCQYCGGKAPDIALEVDHIIPESQGGASSIENGITACYRCNLGKSNRDPEQAKHLVEHPCAKKIREGNEKAKGSEPVSMAWFERKNGISHYKCLWYIEKGLIEASYCEIVGKWTKVVADSRILTQEEFYK